MKMRDAAREDMDNLASQAPTHTDNGSICGFAASIQLEEKVSCIPAKDSNLDRQVQQHHHPAAHSLRSTAPSTLTNIRRKTQQPSTRRADRKQA